MTVAVTVSQIIVIYLIFINIIVTPFSYVILLHLYVDCLCVHNGLVYTGYYVCVTYQARRYSILAHYVRLVASRIGYG